MKHCVRAQHPKSHLAKSESARGGICESHSDLITLVRLIYLKSNRFWKPTKTNENQETHLSHFKGRKKRKTNNIYHQKKSNVKFKLASTDKTCWDC